MQPAPLTTQDYKPPAISKNRNSASPLIVILSTVAIFFASQIVAIFVVGLTVSIFQPGTSVDFDKSAIDQFVYIFIAEILAAWLAIAIVKRRKLPLSFIGLGRRPKMGDLGKGALGFLAFFAVLILASAVVSHLSPDFVDQKQDVGFTNLATNTDQILAFLALVILPPIGEEILVRGYLYSGLRKAWNLLPAMLVTSVFFG
jgi:membrane protease YdiL (CAAX protease family)